MKRWIACACTFMLMMSACTTLQSGNDTASTFKAETAVVSSDISSRTDMTKSGTATGATAADGLTAETSGTDETLADFEVVVGKNKRIPFTAICQYPELPTGCEVTSLSMVFNHYGHPCDKCDIADYYLTKGEVGTVDFHEAFEGDPRDESSYGCYANVIVKAAEKIIAEKNYPLKVSDLTGTPLDSLLNQIDQNRPVIVWGTQDCQEGHFSVTWNVDGKELVWFTPEHCMVLVGYDESSVWVADPIYGKVISYDKDTFESSYRSLFQQAVLLQPA